MTSNKYTTNACAPSVGLYHKKIQKGSIGAATFLLLKKEVIYGEQRTQ